MKLTDAIQNITQTVIVLSASTYDFKDDSGKALKGTTLHYVLASDLSPHEDPDPDRNFKGYRPVKATLPLDAYQKLDVVPGIYNLVLTIEAGSDGKIKTVPIDFAFISGISE